MTKIIGVRFKPAGKMYYFDPQDFDIKRGDNVVVETSRGIEYGEAASGVREVEDSAVVKPLKGVLRMATEEDTLRHEENKKKEKEAYSICLEKIEKHGLDMKLVEVEYTFDGNKILFYFTSDGRVDFRELVKDLASVFKTRIELRQIGVRDESKTLGSIGVCGRNLCCSQFLGEFMPVSIKMAKEQGLSLNPSKISGACGRLMCCLKYEQDTYEALMSEAPKNGAVVSTPEGKGTVVNVALLKGKVKVRFESGNEITMKEFDVRDIKAYDGKNSETDEEERFIREENALLESLSDEEPKTHEKQAKPEKRREQRRHKTPHGNEGAKSEKPQIKQPRPVKPRPVKTPSAEPEENTAEAQHNEGEEKSAKKGKRNYYRRRNYQRKSKPENAQ